VAEHVAIFEAISAGDAEGAHAAMVAVIRQGAINGGVGEG
jgi:DNA-binding FadR family transcriptional regulator